MMNRLAALPPRIIDALGAGAIVLICGAAYVLGVHPALDRRAAAEQDRRTLLAELAAAASAAEEVKSAQGVRDRVLARRSESLQLERADQVNTRISRLTSLATAESISIQQLSPGAPRVETGKPYTAVPIRVQGVGAFADCVDFLRRLREEHRDIAVPSVRLAISEPASENRAARIDMTLDLVWHAAPDDSAGRR